MTIDCSPIVIPPPNEDNNHELLCALSTLPITVSIFDIWIMNDYFVAPTLWTMRIGMSANLSQSTSTCLHCNVCVRMCLRWWICVDVRWQSYMRTTRTMSEIINDISRTSIDNIKPFSTRIAGDYVFNINDAFVELFMYNRSKKHFSD